MSIFRSFGVLVRTHKRGANLVTARPPSSARMRRLIVSPESIAFLRDRARTETILASKTNCGPAEWSHSQLARLYLERCTEITGNVGQIVGSVIETDFLDQTEDWNHDACGSDQIAQDTQRQYASDSGRIVAGG
jgi:hypothetical protein